MANYTGGVLTKATNSFLFNQAITPAQLGAYIDSVNGIPVLLIKKLGYSIYLGSKSKVFMTCNDPGAWRGLLIVLNPECPCDECDYEYQIKVKSSVQRPGMHNSMIKPVTNIYSGRVPAIECDEGYIISSQVIAMESDLITQINNYEPINTDGLMPSQLATRAYTIEDADTSDASTLTITIGGTNYLVTSDVGGNISLVEAINADAGIAGRVRAIYISDPNDATYQFMLFGGSDTNPVLYTVTAGTDTTIEERGIILLSTDPQFNIAVEMHPSLGSVTGFNMVEIYTASGADVEDIPHCIQFSDSVGSVSKADDADCCIDNLFAFDVLSYEDVSTWQLTNTEFGGVQHIYGYSADSDAYVTYEDESDDLVVRLATEKGAWPKLSNADVFREFAHQPNHGALAQQTWANQPIPDTRYCKIDIVWEDEIADLVGANHMNSRRGAVTLYFPMSTKCGDVFDPNNAMGAAGVVAGDMVNLEDFIDAVIDGEIGQGSSSS